jgi:hypothetical protein
MSWQDKLLESTANNHVARVLAWPVAARFATAKELTNAFECLADLAVLPESCFELNGGVWT